MTPHETVCHELTWHSDALAESQQQVQQYEDALGEVATEIAVSEGRTEVMPVNVARAAVKLGGQIILKPAHQMYREQMRAAGIKEPEVEGVIRRVKHALGERDEQPAASSSAPAAARATGVEAVGSIDVDEYYRDPVCADCDMRYDDPAWVEAVLEHATWAKISPSSDGNGLLCVQCIANRLVKSGLKDVPVKLTAGPMIAPEPAPAEQAGEVDKVYEWPVDFNTEWEHDGRRFKVRRDADGRIQLHNVWVHTADGRGFWGHPLDIHNERGNWRRVTPSAAGEAETLQAEVERLTKLVAMYQGEGCDEYPEEAEWRALAFLKNRTPEQDERLREVANTIINIPHAQVLREQLAAERSRECTPHTCLYAAEASSAREAWTVLSGAIGWSSGGLAAAACEIVAQLAAERSRREALGDKNDRQAATISRDMDRIAELEAQLATITAMVDAWNHFGAEFNECFYDGCPESIPVAIWNELQAALAPSHVAAVEAKPERRALVDMAGGGT